MENKLILGENKILEHNEKSFKDTQQLFEIFQKLNLEELIKMANESPEAKETIDTLHLNKGKTIWVELKTEDSYLSKLIFAWMYTKSEFDGTTGLQALGFSMQKITFNKPGLTEEMIENIKELYENVLNLHRLIDKPD